MKIEQDAHPLYACDKCASHLHSLDELCPRCHKGKGVKVWPIPPMTKEERRRLNERMGMVKDVPRLKRTARPIDDDKRRKEHI